MVYSNVQFDAEMSNERTNNSKEETQHFMANQVFVFYKKKTGEHKPSINAIRNWQIL